jgi:hypothetical protein
MLVFVILYALLTTALGSIKDCDPSSVFRPRTLALNPDPPMRGDRVYMTVQFDNPGSDITDGKATTTAVLNGIPISPSTSPLCDVTPCPIVHGFNDRSTSSVWPDVSGKLNSKITWMGSGGESLLCIQLLVLVSEMEQQNNTEPIPYNSW